MKRYRFEIIFAALLAALFAGFWLWLTPGTNAKLTRVETETYIRRIEPRLPIEGSEKPAALARLRAWGEADDGDPVYMLNLMRYFDRIRRVPGGDAIHGTPAEANAHYEKVVLPILAQLGAYPLIAGEPAGIGGDDGRIHSNLLELDPAVDDWSRVLVVRYPSRRAFFELISDAAYQDVMPFKLAALRVALIPLRKEVTVPDPRLMFGLSCLTVFLLVGWLRATRRRREPAA